MDTLTVSARIYLAVVTTTALALTALLALGTAGPSDHLERAGFIVAVTALAYRFPISFSFKRRMYLDVVALGCAVMILDPGPAAIAVGAGAVIGQLMEHGRLDECVFNASQAMLQTIAGGLLLGWIGWELSGLMHLEPLAIAGLVMLTATVFSVNSLLLAGIIGFQSGVSPLTVLSDHRTLFLEFVVQATQVAAAVMAALIVTMSPLLTGLIIVPASALYLILRRNVQRQKFAIIGMLDTLADLVDYRDPYTATHTRRVAELSRQIGLGLELPREQVDLIAMAARFHSLGSLTLPPQTAETVGGLDSDEWNIMRQVPSMSADLLVQFSETALAGELVRHHLERFDGEGYPEGLAGNDIPLGSRIIAVADSIDTMTRPRPYRPALSAAELRSELTRFRGSQWDPDVVDITLQILDTNPQLLALAADVPEAHTSGRAAARTIEQRLQHQAFHDPLTDLPNRLLLMDRLSRGLTGEGRQFAVLFIDLDGFKSINDRLGHRAGDQLLIEVGQRVRSEIAGGDFLARLGGDEFVVLLWDIRDADHAAQVARRVIAGLSAPLPDICGSLSLAASVGVTVARPGVDTPDDLLQRADEAMYDAKRAGRGNAAIAHTDRPRVDDTDIESNVAD